MGIIPANAELTDINPSMQKWNDIPQDQREFQTRLMEVFAGFLEHTDNQYGRLIDELENLGIRDNTLVIYINGDNGAAPAGVNGSISELLGQNAMLTTVEDHIRVLNEEYGGLDALGGSLLEAMNRYKVRPKKSIPTGKVNVEVIVKAQAKKPLAPSLITLKVNGKTVGKTMAETTVPALFTASETFDVGMDLGSAVAMEYHDRVPFKFTGKINSLKIKYIE